jgi:hypothetical protein
MRSDLSSSLIRQGTAVVKLLFAEQYDLDFFPLQDSLTSKCCIPNSWRTLSGMLPKVSLVTEDMTARQYIGGAERTTPLEEGPEPVRDALKLIQHRIATALGKHIHFNEVLSAAYMEKQKMAVSSCSPRILAGILTSAVVSQRQRTRSWTCDSLAFSWFHG